MAISISLLSACGGGGSGGAVIAPSAPNPFTSFTTSKPVTIVINGPSQEATYTYDTGTGKITSLSAASAFDSGGSITVAIVGAATTLTAKSALGTTISLNTANGDSIGVLLPSDTVKNASFNGQNIILLFNRITGLPAWDYQAFGVWETREDTTASGAVGAMSFGAETPGASVPTIGTAVFSGATAGIYFDSAGNSFFTGSGMSATTNFATRSIAFATTGTFTSTDFFITRSANPNLDMSGTLTYAPGSNLFTGAVTTVGGGLSNAPMSGSATGKFYGPAAQEMGGTFAVSGGGTAGYIGGFGARR